MDIYLIFLFSLMLTLVLCQTPEDKAKAMLARMNLDDKILMLHGSPGSYVGDVPENKNLKIPPLTLNDGPQGFRTGGSTCWPSDLTLAATWDLDLASKFGVAIGKEFFDKGSNVMLGPGVNVARVPRNGRNFEYISGEDPFLGYKMVQPVVKGIQSSNVIANVKHYVNNNQENNRNGVNEIVDERTRHEIYLPPFAGAVEADLGSIMCSYNLINGRHACENNVTLNVDLKGHLGFKGWVMSDWGGTHSVSINQGLDQEMPGGTFMGGRLKNAVQSGSVSQAKIDDSVLRMLIPMYKFGIFDHYEQWINSSAHGADVTSKEHSRIARQISAAASVLLTNNGVLPFTKEKVRSIAIIGKDGQSPTVHGGGSGGVDPTYVVTPYQGIAKRFSNSSKMNCSYDPDTDYFTQPSSQHSASSKEECCSNCYNSGVCNYFTYIPPSTCWYHPEIGEKRAHKGYVSGSCGASTANVTYADGSNVNDAVKKAKDADVAIVFMSTSSGEGRDRANLDFPNDQTNVVNAVIAGQPNTVVVCFHPGAILMPWASKAAAVINMYMPGLEVGNALAEVLWGDVNPSGRSPMTMPNKNNEIGFTQAQYPGINGNANYTEGLEVGYRWYDSHKVTPNFPFGHGLSYTTFTYANLQINGMTVKCDIANTGKFKGAEVVQLYVGFPSSAGEPPMQLKGFFKTDVLLPASHVTVTFQLTDRDLSIWDVSLHGWKKLSGDYIINIGASSRDFRLTGKITV